MESLDSQSIRFGTADPVIGRPVNLGVQLKRMSRFLKEISIPLPYGFQGAMVRMNESVLLSISSQYKEISACFCIFSLAEIGRILRTITIRSL